MADNTTETGARPPRDISWSTGPRIIASGLCMGTADLVPGVSGGTMAVALGIYRQLLAAISSVGLPALKALLSGRVSEALACLHWRFITCLGLGMGVAVVIMGKVIKLHEMVRTSPKPVYAVFFGLVLASAVVLVRGVGKWQHRQSLALVLGAGVGLVVVTLVPTSTPDNALFIFAAGAIAICAMILPGISGSFVLLILGKYEYVINAVLHFDLTVAVPFALGCAAGLMAFARVLGRALDRWHDTMIAGLTGLLVGSLWRIWPYQHLDTVVVRGKEKVIGAQAFWPDGLELSVAALVIMGIALVFGVEWAARARSAEA
jgi:putative membrane protein